MTRISGYMIGGMLMILCAAGIALAQRIGGSRGTDGTGGFNRAAGRGPVTGAASGLIYLNGDPYGREADGRLYMWPRRPIDISDRRGVPEWDFDPHFKGNVFTFVRINYHSWRYSDSWATSYPTSDLNFSFRLQELTSFKVNPHPIWLKLTDKELFDYPFIYMVEVETLEFEDGDVPALRKYLLNGGFLMVDDFWGVQAWEQFHTQMQRVFPDREPVELDISHPIFHYIFDLKEKPQIPKLTFWARNKDTGITWVKPDAKEPQFWAYYDDKGRMMALICHNTDLGEGWSRELSLAKLPEFRDQNLNPADSPASADYERFFHQFCEKLGYPMGVNIIVYVMTH